MNARASVHRACVACGREATRNVGGRDLCDDSSCLSRTQGTRDKEQGTRNDSTEGVNRGLYVVATPCVREENRREPELTGLIRDHERRKLEPIDVTLGPLPADASQAMRKVAADIRLLLGLRAAVDWYEPLPYSTRFCAERCGLHDQGHASRVLRALVEAGVIRYVGALDPRGQPYGTKLYQAP